MDKEQTFVNLFDDSGFKAVYADRNNKHLLITLLNHVLPDDAHVHDIVEYRDREQERDTVYSKRTILDLICVDETGSIFSVEVQQEVDSVFFNRCVYYAAGHYHGELLDGMYYDALHPVYVVAILKTLLPHDDESLWDADHLISEYRFIEKRTGDFAPPTIFITFVELGRFSKSEADCRSERDRVFYWFNNSCLASDIPLCASGDPEMQTLVEATRIAAFPPEKKNIYNRDVMNELDIKYSEKKKFEAGKSEGLLIGREEGHAEGLAEGLARGREEERLAMARNMLAIGMPISQIAKVTGLTHEQVKTL